MQLHTAERQKLKMMTIDMMFPKLILWYGIYANFGVKTAMLQHVDVDIALN